MTKFFQSPAGTKKQERIPYPEHPLTQDELLDDEALRCVLYVAHKTGIAPNKLISQALKDWYDVSGDGLIDAAERRRDITLIGKATKKLVSFGQFGGGSRTPAFAAVTDKRNRRQIQVEISKV